MRHVTVPLFMFDELGTECQQKVIEEHRDINVDHAWYEDEIEYFKDEMLKKGYEVDDVQFSGFSSQGDGALWVGGVHLQKWLNSHPRGTYLTKIHEYIEKVAPSGDDVIFITRMAYPHYCHRFMMGIDYDDFYGWDGHNISGEDMIIFSSVVLSAARDEAHELYRTLETIYDGLRSDEEVIETIKCNEYEFTLDGDIWKDSGC